MQTTPLNFEFPHGLTVEEFLDTLSKQKEYQVAFREQVRKTFYDSFDWRLYNAGLAIEFNQTRKTSHLILVDRSTGNRLVMFETQKAPVFADQIPNGSFRSRLKPVLKMRALLAIGTLACQRQRLNILNKDGKTTLRIDIEVYDELPIRVILNPLKGYTKVAEKLSQFLKKTLKLTANNLPLLDAVLEQQGRRPKESLTSQKIQLDQKMRSDQACKAIYSHLLKIIKLNEAGTIADTDSEFLHDFRVAVRKTRAGLVQLKNVFPDSIIVQHKVFFSWLGQITSQTRDMDVYLLAFEDYKSSLPISIREDLNPLRSYLEIKQKKAHQALVKHLHSEKYINGLAEWERFLQEPVPESAKKTHAILPVKQFANKRIWKLYNRVLREGLKINDDSPGEDLHELRKTCKKLRYLMEFFQSLYPPKKIKVLIRKLKQFQEVLGDFQDYEVQEDALLKFSEEMMAKNIPAATFLAMGVLIQNLETLRKKARDDFNSRFTDFKQVDNRAAFAALFEGKEK